MRANLRNAGFELGNTNFWTIKSYGTLEIESGETHGGSYSGKITTDAVAKIGIVLHNDFIEVEYGNVINLSAWVKGVAGDDVYLKVYRSDSDGDDLDAETVKVVTASGGWQKIESQYVVGSDERYIHIYIDVRSALGSAICYFDDCVVCIISLAEQAMRIIEIADLTNLLASGDTSGDLYRLYGFRDYYAELECTAIAGAGATCDVTVCELDQYDNERLLGTFTQYDAPTDQRIGIASPIGKGMYIKYAEGGGWTDNDFKVKIIGVR